MKYNSSRCAVAAGWWYFYILHHGVYIMIYGWFTLLYIVRGPRLKSLNDYSVKRPGNFLRIFYVTRNGVTIIYASCK